MKRIAVGMLLLFVMGCAEGEPEDNTCWAEAAANVIYEHDLSDGRNVYDEMVNTFGKGPQSTYNAIAWWLETNEIEDVKLYKIVGPERQEIDALFEELEIMVFIVPYSAAMDHALTAYRPSDVDGYEIIRVIYLTQL